MSDFQCRELKARIKSSGLSYGPVNYCWCFLKALQIILTKIPTSSFKAITFSIQYTRESIHKFLLLCLEQL